MSKTKADMGSFIWIIVILLVGGFLGNFFINWSGFGTSWMQGLIIAFVQAILLAVFGILMGKAGIMQIIYATVAIFVGGILGGLLIEYLAVTGLFQTFVVLAIQSVILIFTGLAGKGKLKLL